jgi:uncharacterized protein YcaQ
VRTLTATEARRLAILDTMLAGPRLTIWSRLGSYDTAELKRLLEDEPRQLFEYSAFLLPITDLPLHRAAMHRSPRTTGWTPSR